MRQKESGSVSTRLAERIHAAIAEGGGWLPFDRFMALALYAPGLGYYARGARQFGSLPSSGSDFVTAPELSPYFGRALARQVAEALAATDSDEIWEFGAGSGALAWQLLGALDASSRPVRRYRIVEVSGALRSRQQERLAAFGARIEWPDGLPAAMQGVVIGNEVLDAMPVQLIHRGPAGWLERGVVRGAGGDAAGPSSPAGFAWGDRQTSFGPPPLMPPHDPGFAPGATVELHAQAEAFVATVAERLTRGAAFFIDYGFPAAEYYHLQRSAGTMMCHRAHRADTDPLADVGEKDITAHVDFSGIALAGQDAGLDVVGYTSQAHFLINCGLLDLLPAGDARALANAQKLLTEHEMGELFKVIGFARDADASFTAAPLGFARGDRTHTL